MSLSVTFTHSYKTEVERIVHTSLKTANGFYEFYRFAVLPRFIEGNSATVHLPELKYTSIPHYWQQVSQLNDQLPIQVPEPLAEQVSKIVGTGILLKKNQIEELELKWQHLQPHFFKFLRNEFPKYYDCVGSIEVRVTSYGTIASFSVLSDEKKQHLTCYVRYDGGLSAVAEAIISSLTRVVGRKLDLAWEGTEAVSDYLLDLLVARKILPQPNTTTSSLKNAEAELLNESRTYLQKIGVPTSSQLKLNDGLVYINSQKIHDQLSEVQQQLLHTFIAKKNSVVTFDEIADILDPKEFSLWAVHKQVQRLRDKLTTLGFPGYHIQSIRGVGYSLINH